MKESYYIYDSGNSLGPYSLSQVREMYRAGTINAKTLVSFNGSVTWQEISAIEDKFAGPSTNLLRPSTSDHSNIKSSARLKIKPGLAVLLLLPTVGFFGWEIYNKYAQNESPDTFTSITSALNANTTTAVVADNPAPAAPMQPPAPVEVPVTDLNWTVFRSLYGQKSTLTDLQKDHYWTQYQGKRVRWTGTVESISEGLNGMTMQVKMDPNTFASDLIIDLRPSEKSKALELEKGVSVTFTATLNRWGDLMPISMTDGVIDN